MIHPYYDGWTPNVSFKVSVQAIKQSSEPTRPAAAAAAAGRANFFGPERAPLDLASFA
jgi:hypothetical protein